MSCRSTRSSAIGLLVVALLFSSLLLPRLPTVCARHVVGLKAKDGLSAVGEDAGKAAGGSRPVKTVEMRAAARKHRVDEMYDMLRRDYGQHAHGKRPIHNDQPVQEDEP